ncbi:MAG TPA: hypothetical protein VJO35_12525, partial [Terriglobales bacterium]|nr:hypothetical protein [Terriglobales bacterium]
MYDAAADQKLWTSFLESLALETGGHAAAIVMHDSGQRTMALDAGVGPEFSLCYRQHYHETDIWAIRGLERTAAGWIGVSEELCRWEEFRRTETYNDFALPMGSIAHGMFALLSKEQSRLMNLSVFRTPRQGPFDEEDVEVLRFLAPHLRRAFRLHFQLVSLQERNRSFDLLLDSLPQGIILLGATGNVLHMNRAARQVCEPCDGLI